MTISPINLYNPAVYNWAVKRNTLQFSGSNDGDFLGNDNLRAVVAKLKARVDQGKRTTVLRQLIEIHEKETKAEARQFWNQVSQSLFGQSIGQLSMEPTALGLCGISALSHALAQLPKGEGTSRSSNSTKISKSPEEKVIDLFIAGTPLDEYEPPSELPDLLT